MGNAEHRHPPTVRVFLLFSTKVSSTNDVRVAFADSVDRVQRTMLTRTTSLSFKFQTWTRRNSLTPLGIVQIQQALQDNTGSESHHFSLLSPERSLPPASPPHARWRRPMDGCVGIVSTSYLEGLGPSIMHKDLARVQILRAVQLSISSRSNLHPPNTTHGAQFFL